MGRRRVKLGAGLMEIRRHVEVDHVSRRASGTPQYKDVMTFYVSAMALGYQTLFT